MSGVDATSDLNRYINLGHSAILFVGFSSISLINIRILWALYRWKHGPAKAGYILIFYIGSWMIDSMLWTAFYGYDVAFWRYSNNYNSVVLFVLAAPAYSTLYSVFISRWFLTLECIFVINLWHNYRCWLNVLCTLFCIIIDSGMLALFITRFLMTKREPFCWFISCIFESYSYLIAMNFINAIVVSSFFCSLWSLFLFYKTRATHSSNEHEQTSMQQIIRFTIILDLYFNVVPQILVVVTTHWLGINFQTFVGPIYRVLYVSYGLIINLRFYVCLVRRPAKVFIQTSLAQRGIRTGTLPIT